MRRRVEIIAGAALLVLLLSGCDAPDESKPPGCLGSDERQLQQSGPTDDAGCVLGHGNTQSTDRKW